MKTFRDTEFPAEPIGTNGILWITRKLAQDARDGADAVPLQDETIALPPRACLLEFRLEPVFAV